MKVFIAGATGVLGRRLVRQFAERGHEVIGLARGESGRALVHSNGGAAREADIFDADSLARAAEGADAVVHAATAIPTAARPAPRDWELNDRLRRDGTRALCECAALVGARLYLQQSVVWVARPADESEFDEDTPPGPEPLYRSAHDAERIAREAAARRNFKSIVLRCGGFYSADAAHTRALGEGLLKRRLPLIGGGRAVWSSIHSDDAASAFVAAAEAGKEGLWHVVDDEPAPLREVLLEFARQLGAPAPRRVPVWLARLAAGRDSVKFLNTSTRTTNSRFRRDVGWSPRFPTYREGLTQIVAEWRKDSDSPLSRLRPPSN